MQKLKAEIEGWLKENEAKRKENGGQYLLGVSEGYQSVIDLISIRLTCGCESCKPNIWGNMRMIVCKKCGNKRCPHATDHRNECTNSNEVGQIGSSYQHIKND